MPGNRVRDRMQETYDGFARAADTGALEVVFGGQPHEETAARAT
ncbi:hypothetical protein ACIPJS_15410 [Streptomyces sp. NPDC086783]